MVAVTPPAPVIEAGVPGMPLVIVNVRVTVVPLQPITVSVMVPVVNAVPYFIFTLLPWLLALRPIVVGLDTDQVNELAPADVMLYKALSPAPILAQAFVAPIIEVPTVNVQAFVTVMEVVAVLEQPVVVFVNE